MLECGPVSSEMNEMNSSMKNRSNGHKIRKFWANFWWDLALYLLETDRATNKKTLTASSSCKPNLLWISNNEHYVRCFVVIKQSFQTLDEGKFSGVNVHLNREKQCIFSPTKGPTDSEGGELASFDSIVVYENLKRRIISSDILCQEELYCDN